MSTPRFQPRGAAKRERPIWTRDQFGPWQCDAWVVPITGLRNGYPLLEVGVRWKSGPPLDASLGPTPATGMSATDTFYIDREAPEMRLSAGQAVEVALELARRSADLLQAGAKPNMPALARAILRRR